MMGHITVIVLCSAAAIFSDHGVVCMYMLSETFVTLALVSSLKLMSYRSRLMWNNENSKL